MSIDIRLPKITAASEKEQLTQVKGYLYQLVEQLNFALKSIESGAAGNYAVTSGGASNSSAKTESKDDSQSKFNEIKALIIKSADIVNAYYDEIDRRLDGKYVAQSDFGTYSEETALSISESSEYIKNIFANMQEIDSDIESIEGSLIEVNAHIKTGLLDYDESGAPVYGVEVGQINIIDGKEVFNKYARFVSDRLSFYDQNDQEVAYISNYKLFITHVDITGSISHGGFITDITNGIAVKWKG